MAFKPILEGKSCIIAEQTGSGKTLAYVAPLVQRLRADEARTLGKSLSKKPRVLVLVPTGELAAQVLIRISLRFNQFSLIVHSSRLSFV